MRLPLVLSLVLPLLSMGCAERAPGEGGAGNGPAAPAAKPPEKREPLSCVIRCEPTCELGKAPKVSVEITNQTDADIYLVGGLDGSASRRRYPHCYFEVTGPDGKPAVSGWGQCGNMNTLREKDFVKVPPGGSFDPYQKIDAYGFFATYQLYSNTFRAAGQYRIRFFYSTDCAEIAKWAGDGVGEVRASRTLARLFRQVPKAEASSNEVLVTVEGPGK